MKVIFHIDELNKWSLLLANVRNLINVDKVTDIVILANAEAVLFYFNIDNQNLLNNLPNKVTFVACNNSINSRHLDVTKIIDGIKIVPIGVLELIAKQNEGYAYIKP